MVEGFNARQVMLKYKAAHGSGNNLTFPEAEQIEANMQEYPDSFEVDVITLRLRSGGRHWEDLESGCSNGPVRTRSAMMTQRDPLYSPNAATAPAAAGTKQ